MPKPVRRIAIKSPQKSSIAKLPEKIRFKATTPKLKMSESSPRINRLDNLMRTDKHIGDLAIIYDYDLKVLKSSTRGTLEQIKRNINTTLKNIEKEVESFSNWKLSDSESIALNFLKTNYNKKKAIAEQKIKEIDEILKEKN